MATKRGQISRSVKQMAASKAVVPRFRTQINSERADKPPAKGQNFIERLPSEILLKILSYLDAASLFSIGHCNKLFYQLANDNALWFNLLIAEFEEKKCAKKTLLKKKSLYQASGLWKQTYFNNILSSQVTKSTSFLKQNNWYTGLPSQTKEVLRQLGVAWELTVTDKSGHECTLELSWSKFFQTSVTLCWFGEDSLPDHEQISTLQLHGVRRIDLGLPSLETPCKRSLMVKLDMQPLTKSTQVIIGQDRLVQLKLLQPGVIVGVWRDQCTIAFIMFTLHFHKLVDRSIHPSSDSPYVELIKKPLFDDIDPEYGLHGYGLHISLHDSVRNLMSERFTQLFCHREDISDKLIRLTAVSRTNLSQHKLLSGSITLPWKCEAIQGAVENCCIMSLTLLHTSKTPFKCLCTPVSMEMETTSLSYDYDGDSYLIHYQDSDFQVKMQLVKTRKDGQVILVSLNVYLSVSHVNKLFVRNY